jgi:hypothetical protein
VYIEITVFDTRTVKQKKRCSDGLRSCSAKIPASGGRTCSSRVRRPQPRAIRLRRSEVLDAVLSFESARQRGPIGAAIPR